MIAIVNIDPNPRKSGEHLYSLRINETEICRFTHRREDPLARILVNAAMAAADPRYRARESSDE